MKENDQPSLFADTIEPVPRISADQIFHLRIEAVPLPENPESEEFAGGVVSYWVDADDLRSAEFELLEEMQAEQWQPTAFEEWALVTRNECDAEEAAAFDEAIRDGASLTIYAWKHGEEPEADV